MATLRNRAYDCQDAPPRTITPAEPGTSMVWGGAPLDFDEDSGFDNISSEDSVIDQLAGSDSLILLFDSAREREVGDSYDYFIGPLLRLAQRTFAQTTEDGDRLPHYLAVCATKFDDRLIYESAARGGYISVDQEDPAMFPRVHPARAREFFEYLSNQSDKGRTDLLLHAISRYFRPERVRYFITSAVGFYLDSKVGRFNENDYQNVVWQNNGEVAIRGGIYPINVVEPVLWMGEQ